MRAQSGGRRDLPQYKRSGVQIVPPPGPNSRGFGPKLIEAPPTLVKIGPHLDDIGRFPIPDWLNSANSWPTTEGRRRRRKVGPTCANLGNSLRRHLVPFD